MKNKRLFNVVKVLILLFVTVQSNAIDIQLQNYSISPNPVSSGQNFTISFDIVNVADGSGESSTFPHVVIDNDGSFTPSQILSESTLNSFTAGWFNGTEVSGILIFDLDLSGNPLLPGQSVNFQANFTAGINPVQLSAITTVASDFLLTDSNPANNAGVTNVEVVPGGGNPDLDFDDGATSLSYSGVENQVAPILMSFRVLNLGADSPAGGSMSIMYDDFSIGYDSILSTIPAGWSCFAQTGGVECSTNGSIGSGSSTDFQLAFIAGPQGSYAFNGSLQVFSAIDSDLSNNGIDTNIVLAAAVPDLEMGIVTPNTFPVDVGQGSTAPTPFTFRVSNIGNTVFQAGDVEVFIGHDSLFTIANVQTAAFGWSCNPDIGGFICLNTSMLVTPSDQIDISGEITGYPAPIMVYPSAVYAIVTDLTGAEASAGLDVNNDFDVSVGIVPLDTDLELLKFAKDGPGAANLISGDWPLGTNFYYQIHVNNLSTNAGTVVEVFDSLPEGIQFVNDLSNGSWVCIADPFINEFTSQGVTCNHPSVPASSPNFGEIIVLEVTPLNLGMKSNSATVSSVENDSNLMNNDNIAMPSVVNIINTVMNPDVDITKTILSGVIATQGGPVAEQNTQVTYQILAKNNSSAADVATNVVIDDVLPVGVTFVSFNELGPNFNCTFFSGPQNKRRGAPFVSCTAASLPFTTASDGVEITVNVTGAVGSFIDNTATVTADNDATPGNNSSSSGAFEVIAGIPQVDLVMFKDAQTLAGVPASSFDVNEHFNYVLTITNSGLDAAAAAEVFVSDIVPPDIDIVSISSATGWDCSASDLPNGIVECINTVAIDTSSAYEIIIEVVSQVVGNYDNLATVDLDVSSIAVDSDPSNNSDNVVVDITSSAQVDLVMFKDAQTLAGVSASSFDVNEHFNYALTITNSGLDSAAAAEVLVSDIVPPDVDIVSISSATGWDCSASDLPNRVVECINTVAIDTSSAFEIIIEVVSQVAGNYDNLATVNLDVSSIAVDTDPINNADNVLVDITSPGQVDLNLLKDAQSLGGSTSVDNFLVGESFEYKIVVHNIGVNDAFSGEVEIIDTLPSGINLDSIPNSPDWDCSGTVGNTVNCINTTTIGAVSGFLTLIIPVSSQLEGVYLNSADVALVGGSSLTDIDPSNNNGTMSVTINPSSGNLTLAKSVIGGVVKNRSQMRLFGNTNFAIGDTVTYTLLAKNTSASSAINDIVVTDALDTNFLSFNSINIIQSATNFSCSIDASSIVTCTNSSGTPMNPGDTFEVEILATAVSGGINVSNTANISSISTGDNMNSNTVLIDIDSGVLPTTLTVQKQATIDGIPVTSVTKGTAYTYIVTVQNTGNADAENVMFVDNMPAGLIVSSAIGTDWLCGNVGQQYTCNLTGPLLVNASSSVEFNVLDGSAANINQLQNVVDVTSDNAPMVSAVNNIDLTQIGVNLNVSHNPDPVVEGSTFELLVEIVNTGSEELQGVQVINNLPDGFSYSAQRFGSICSINGLEMTCNVADPVAVGTTKLIVLAVNSISKADTNASYLNVTTLSGSNFPSTVTSNTSINVTQDGVLNYTVSIDDNIDPVPVGASFMYDVTFTNTGSLPITSMDFDVAIASELVLTLSTPNNANCTASNAGLTCQSTSNLNLLPGDTVNMLNLEVNSPSFIGDVSTTVSAIAQASLNASASQVTTIVAISPDNADLSVIKTASAKSVNSGDQFNWNIVVTNNGPDSAQNVSLTDHLPSGFEVLSATINGSDACKVNGLDLICNIGTLVNEETKSITILGTATLATGVLENLASVTSDTNDKDTKNNTDIASIMVNPITLSSADIYVEVLAESTVIQGGIAQFNVQAGNNGPDSSSMPSISMQASGNINNVVVESGSDWNCQVKGLVMVNCNYTGTEMISGHQSTLHVKLDPNEVMGTDGQVLGLIATITSETADPNASNNTGSAEINAQAGNPTEEEIFAALQAALAGIGNQQTMQAIENVASYCGGNYEGALDGLCVSLFNAAVDGEGALINQVMEQLTPNEVIGQSSSVSEIATAQFRNVGARLSQLRGGGGSGFSTAGLNARYGNGSIPLGMLAYLNDSPEESAGQNEPAMSFVSPWGFFVNGSISMGERDATGRELGFDFDSFGITAGVDYRLDAKKVLGLALGYANFDSTIEDSAELNSTGLTLTGYGSFYVNDNFYVDSRISIAKPNFDQSRNIDFDIGDISVHRTAVGDTSGNQYSFAMSAGYHFNKNAWNITPNASLNYVNTDIDGFTETGAGVYNFIYSKQAIESLVWSAGIKVSKAISLKNGVITPQFDFDYNYESLNDGNNIEARFIMAPEDEIFIIETDSPDRSYGSAGVGLVYISSNGKQAYINYRSLFALEGFSRGTFNIGARFEF